MHALEVLGEVQRQFNVCNACRYCEAYCAVFPAAQLRPALDDGDVLYLANLCHDCRDCFDACMFAPPHAFAINIPALLAAARIRTYRRYTWPAIAGELFRNARARVATLLVAAAVVLAAILIGTGPANLSVARHGPGAFYQIVPVALMILPAMLVSVYGIGVMVAGLRGFWRGASGARLSPANVGRALHDAFSLHYMKGGGAGCYYPATHGSQVRRNLHHAVFYGFVLAFVSTTLAAIAQDVFGILPPFAIGSAPVVFGIAGGVLLVVGCSGLLLLKPQADPAPQDRRMVAMDYAFLVILDLAALSGLLLLAFRETPAMGWLLTFHLCTLAGLYVTAPYGKFVHFIFRVAALVKWAGERGR
ncbi:MAG: tricarballylate utilization 4Fe-4S protein TcuB [Candidatus Eremiobacteraeota bacterium]|nr:tricarballylate utilization 4Fe-4S protein TcuB [Candidatus Eremiobacteraeota bacterium]